MIKPTLSITLPSELLAWVKQYKEKYCINISAVIVQLLNKWRAEHNEK